MCFTLFTKIYCAYCSVMAYPVFPSATMLFADRLSVFFSLSCWQKGSFFRLLFWFSIDWVWLVMNYNLLGMIKKCEWCHNNRRSATTFPWFRWIKIAIGLKLFALEQLVSIGACFAVTYRYEAIARKMASISETVCSKRIQPNSSEARKNKCHEIPQR